MTKFNDKNTGDTVSATEYNNVVRAFKNAIENSGQNINADNDQNSKAMANYAHVSTFYTDSGIADAYILSPISNFKGLTALAEGAGIRFRASNPNNGAATANVNGLTPVAIKKEDGITDLDAGDILTDQDTYLRYDGSVWILISRVTDGDFLNSKSASGYTYQPNGLLLQWGSTEIMPGTSPLINLPISFTTSNLIVFTTFEALNTDTSTGVNAIGQVYSKSVSNIQIRNLDSVNHAFSWFSIGY